LSRSPTLHDMTLSSLSLCHDLLAYFLLLAFLLLPPWMKRHTTHLITLYSYALANISNSVYNKWHETELERWLSDHNVPYPKAADRKDLENLVKNNWQSKVVAPYSDWEPYQLTSFLKQKGIDTRDTAAANKQTLLEQVKGQWYETEEKAEDAWSNVKDWIFDRYVLAKCLVKHTYIFAAGRIRNSRLLRISMVSPCLNLANVTPFFTIFDQTSIASQRKLVILRATLATGFMRPGRNLVSYLAESRAHMKANTMCQSSKNGWTPTASQHHSQPLETNLLPATAAILVSPT
jgi:hypothetical protein